MAVKQGKLLEWVEWHPAAFLGGVVELGPEEGWVYTIVINRIYDMGAPIPNEPNKIARRCNMSTKACVKALDSLVASGKIMRADGVLSNPRAEIQLKKRETMIENASKAANTRWGNQNKNVSKINSGKVASHEVGIESAPSRTHANKNESKIRKVKTDSSRPLHAEDYSDEFNLRVWEPYPRKRGTSKKDAFKQWSKLSPADKALVIAAIPVYAQAQAGKDEQYIKHLQFFLSGKIFETVALPKSNPLSKDAGPDTFDRTTWQNLILIYKSTNNWKNHWGPPPGMPGCFVPKDLQDL